jgi:hypothetical protein
MIIMKVKLLRNIVLGGYKRAGGTIELDDITAKNLISKGMAIPINDACQPNLFDEGNCG